MNYKRSMTRQVRRMSAAWLLLSIYVSIMAISVLHSHQSAAEAIIACSDCSHNVHHTGHISIGSDSFHDCVLCHFLSLVYTPTTAIVVGALLFFCRKAQFFPAYSFLSRNSYSKSSRAPPFHSVVIIPNFCCEKNLLFFSDNMDYTFKNVLIML